MSQAGALTRPGNRQYSGKEYHTNAFQSAPEKKKKLTLLSLYVGIIGSILISASQSTMLPAAALEIGGQEIYSLVSTLTGVVSVAAMPLFGFIGASNPAAKTRLYGLSMLLGAAVILARAFARNMWAVIIPGSLYGFVSAGLYVLGYSMIRDIYDSQKAGVYLGLVATFQSIGMLVGPTICGLLIDAGSWRAINHLVWPFLLAAGILALAGVNVKKEDVKELARDSAFDFPGAICLVIFLACFILALSLGSSFAPFGSTASNVLFLLAGVALIGLVLVIRKKGQDSILPVGVLRDRNTLSLSAANLCTNFSNMAVFFFIPTFALYVMKVSGTQAGLTTTLMSVAGLFMGPIYGRMIGRSGSAKKVYLAGTALRILVTLCLVLFLSEKTPLMLLYVLMFVAGFYSSCAGVVFALAPQIMIDPKLRVQSNSVIQISQNFGGSVGTAVYTLVIGMLGVAQGMKVAFIISLVIAVLAFLSGLPLKKPGEEKAA